MAVVRGLKKMYSLAVYKKYGRARQYGAAWFGISEYGDDNELSGVYQRRHGKGQTVYVQMKHMWPRNPRTTPQQNWRTVFSAGVSSWHALTTEERAVYDERAIPLHIEGFNLFLREYLHTHRIINGSELGIYGVGMYGVAEYGRTI